MKIISDDKILETIQRTYPLVKSQLDIGLHRELVNTQLQADKDAVEKCESLVCNVLLTTSLSSKEAERCADQIIKLILEEE